jgi:hypothetical protein
MDNFISAHYETVLTGADETRAKADTRADLIEQDVSIGRAMEAEWDDEVYYNSMASRHLTQNEYNMDIEQARGIAAAKVDSVETFMQMQRQCQFRGA